ncbi:MAG: hypothetical protein IPO83_06510 [Chitinophagaceae bacterium]|nr:hypothetical protein [Chitinophagaceae bacterium]
MRANRYSRKSLTCNEAYGWWRGVGSLDILSREDKMEVGDPTEPDTNKVNDNHAKNF